MLAAILQASDSLSAAIPTFSDRFNFALPLIVILLILMFFLLLKSYISDHQPPEQRPSDKPRIPG